MKLYNVQVGFMITAKNKEEIEDFFNKLLINHSKRVYFKINSIDIEKYLDKPQKE